MNFVYLAQKYLGVSCLMETRQYSGLLWPADAPMEKPTFEVFEAFQREEDRLVRLDRKVAEKRHTERLESHHQARAKALDDIVPYEEKVRAEHHEIRRQTLAQKQEAVDLRHALETRGHVEQTWKEIAAADDVVTKEAQAYLNDTAHYLSWDPHKIPAEVLESREKAHKRIEEGKTVYANWSTLRASEMPTREEMVLAIRAGGEQLERLKKICSQAALKYPRPRKTHF
jgi:hypothetical protein